MTFRFIMSVFAFTGLMAAGCATPKATPQLDSAQQAYSQAIVNPLIVQHAPVPLRDARAALEKAEKAENDAERRHYAYLAEKKIELAETLAAENATQDQIRELSAQKEEFLLNLRAREAEQARQDAREAKERLRAYRGEHREQELERARQEAEKARMDATEAEERLRGYRSEQQARELAARAEKEEQALSEIRELKQEIAELEARHTPRGLLLTFDSVLFETAGSELKPGAELSVSKLAEFLKNHPERRILIEGHTDSQGTEDFNRQLSQERAQEVAEALQAHGVGTDRITARGLGEGFPIAPNTTPAGRQQNRRVEIIIQNPEELGKGAG